MNEDNNAIVNDTELYGKKIKSMPVKEKNIGVDLNDTIINDLSTAQSSQVDFGEIDKFTNISDDRNQLYSLIDQMGADGLIARALEIYASNSTEKNPQGRIVWAESNDSKTTKYITFLLDSLNIDKNIYKWIYSLVKYGDLYIRLYRESEIKDDLFEDENKTLNEDVKVKMFSKNDKYVHYVEAMPNPAEMFELTKFGKTYAYIQAPSTFAANYDYTGEEAWLTNAQNKYLYKFKKNDVTIYPPTEFVHAALEDVANRFPETVEIFRTEAEYNEKEETDLSYAVRRGKSILANVYKIWRELKLLETSVLLNRITKSSIVRTIQVEIGDMPKDRVEPHLRGIKQLIEQKSAIKTNEKMSEYTNPGPIENNVYIPVRNGQGQITVGQIGGDVDVKSLADLDYFRD